MADTGPPASMALRTITNNNKNTVQNVSPPKLRKTASLRDELQEIDEPMIMARGVVVVARRQRRMDATANQSLLSHCPLCNVFYYYTREGKEQHSVSALHQLRQDVCVGSPWKFWAVMGGTVRPYIQHCSCIYSLSNGLSLWNVKSGSFYSSSTSATTPTITKSPSTKRKLATLSPESANFEWRCELCGVFGLRSKQYWEHCLSVQHLQYAQYADQASTTTTSDDNSKSIKPQSLSHTGSKASVSTSDRLQEVSLTSDHSFVPPTTPAKTASILPNGGRENDVSLNDCVNSNSFLLSFLPEDDYSDMTIDEAQSPNCRVPVPTTRYSRLADTEPLFDTELLTSSPLSESLVSLFEQDALTSINNTNSAQQDTGGTSFFAKPMDDPLRPERRLSAVLMEELIDQEEKRQVATKPVTHHDDIASYFMSPFAGTTNTNNTVDLSSSEDLLLLGGNDNLETPAGIQLFPMNESIELDDLRNTTDAPTPSPEQETAASPSTDSLSVASNDESCSVQPEDGPEETQMENAVQGDIDCEYR